MSQTKLDGLEDFVCQVMVALLRSEALPESEVKNIRTGARDYAADLDPGEDRDRAQRVAFLADTVLSKYVL